MRVGPKNSQAIILLGFLFSGIFLCLAFAIYHSIIFHGNQYDDSYITYRYAINFAEGRGLVFNSYERVNSSSSLLYTVILAGFYKLGIHNLEMVAVVLGLTSGAVMIFLLTLLAYHSSQGCWLPVLFILPICLAGSISGWAVSGMETIFYTALIVAFFWAYAAQKTTLSCFFLSMSLLCRPEGILLLIALLIAEVSGLRLGISKKFVIFFTIGLTVLVGYFVFNTIYFENPFPHPIALKRIALYYSPSIAARLSKIIQFFLKNFGIIFLMAWSWVFVVLVVESRHWLLAFRTNGKIFPKLTARAPLSPFRKLLSGQNGGLRPVATLIAFFIVLSFISFLFGPKSDMRRYTVHVIPLLAIGAALCWNSIITRVAPQKRKLSILIILLVVAAFQALLNQKRTSKKFLAWTKHQEARKQLGFWIEQNIPPEEVILSSDIGAIAYCAKNRDFIDVFGLTSRRPFLAVQQKSWESFIQWLIQLKPKWVADTCCSETGEIVTFKIIARPWEFYQGITPRERPYIGTTLQLESQTVLEIISGRYKFVISRVKWPE